MRTLITSLALVSGAVVFAQNDAPTTTPQDPAPHVQSIYEECLLNAGASSWEALHLSADQTARVTELQGRYKASAQAAKEKALADEKAAAKAKGKVKKEVEKAPETKAVEPAMAEGTALEPPADVHGTLEEDVDFSAATATPVIYSPVDAEFRAILTPYQLTMWERRCDTRTSMQP